MHVRLPQIPRALTRWLTFTLPEIEGVVVRPGDLLVLRLSDNADAFALRDALGQILPDNVKVLALDADYQVNVVRAEVR